MRKVPYSRAVAKEFVFAGILIGIASLIGAVFVHVIFPGFYRATGIPEIMFMLVMIGNAVVLFLLRAGFRKYREEYGSAQDTKETEDNQ